VMRRSWGIRAHVDAASPTGHGAAASAVRGETGSERPCEAGRRFADARNTLVGTQSLSAMPRQSPQTLPSRRALWLNGCTPIARTARTSGNEQDGARMASANPSAPCVSGADIPTHHWPERRHSRDGLIDDMDGGREVGRRCFDRLHWLRWRCHLQLRPPHPSALQTTAPTEHPATPTGPPVPRPHRRSKTVSPTRQIQAVALARRRRPDGHARRTVLTGDGTQESLSFRGAAASLVSVDRYADNA
jgi:hypothetical protein